MNLLAILACQEGFLAKNKKNVLLIFYSICFALYLALGGLSFLVLEGQQEDTMQQKILDVKTKVTRKFPDVPTEALDEFLDELEDIGVRGVSPTNNTKWTFGNAVFFSATLLTTIGYGHLSPKTPHGKVACMAYVGFGIPLTLFVLACFVDSLMRLSEAYKRTLFNKLQGFLEPMTIRLIHISSIMLSILVCCFIAPAMIFQRLESEWTYLDALYYCFISLTTVGLGDYVPGVDPQTPNVDLYRICATIFIFFGVAIMMFMMSVTADFFQNYNSCYVENLPFTVSSEKIPINTVDVESYGSIFVQNSKIITEDLRNKIVMPR
ncbi:Potassium channel subfamily K member 6, partial [Stegodyphus mimosarum]